MNEYVFYDVMILGGGLSGSTLALQLKNANPNLSILVLEKRNENAPIAGHKVGESISELGSYYLRDVLQLNEYLEEHQLQKFGFRFFFSDAQNNDIGKRVEFGSKIIDPIPAHQIDRGLFENELIDQLKNNGVEIVLGATLKNVDLDKSGHQVIFEKDGLSFQKQGKWIIDSTGRRGFLKRKLGLEKKIEHNINAAWFRIGCKIDIDDWSDNEIWKTQLDKDRRRLATNHLMGKGYWVWIISLASDNTSFGIVADPSFHSFDQFNTFEKAMNWLKIHEPLAAEKIEIHKHKEIDFKVMKHLAHDTKQFYSTDRWGLTGDAGVFMDPFY
jgi:flavin-dependent dehydrogenase